MWRRIPDWLIYLVIIGVFYLNANRASEPVETPPPPPDLGPLLPSETPRDQVVYVKVDEPQSGTGTAFAIDNKGTWLTARHVVDSCDQVGLEISLGRVLKVDVDVSAQSDTAILSAKWKRAPLPGDLNSQRQVGEMGYFFGFPQGRPGEVAGRLLSRGRMEVRGRYRNSEPVLTWVEKGRTSGLIGTLGGLSGGPALDRDGEVVGVVTAESPRRGRIYTVAPRNLRQLMPSEANGSQMIALNTYGILADRLRRERRVAKVLCYVK